MAKSKSPNLESENVMKVGSQKTEKVNFVSDFEDYEVSGRHLSEYWEATKKILSSKTWDMLNMYYCNSPKNKFSIESGEGRKYIVDAIAGGYRATGSSTLGLEIALEISRAIKENEHKDVICEAFTDPIYFPIRVTDFGKDGKRKWDFADSLIHDRILQDERYLVVVHNASSLHVHVYLYHK